MNNRKIYILLILASLLLGCKKYLDKKSDQNLSIPDNLPDIELLLNNITDLNPGLVGINTASDEYYLNFADYEAAPLFDRQAYVWDPQAQNYNDWQLFYKVILIANTALENIAKIPRTDDPVKWDELKGRALFLRGYNHFQLAQTYAPPYPGNEGSQLGIPIRLSSDFNEKVVRATLQQTYDQVLKDLKEAAALLPPKPGFNKFGSRWAAYAILARAYLMMNNYEQAYAFSDSTLKISSVLMDYNIIDASVQFPFSDNNPEVIYYIPNQNTSLGFYWIAKVDSVLYNSYTQYDLRKELFFMPNGDGTFYFRGNYSLSYIMFNGLATDELYLTKAEAAIRTGKTTEALKSLNDLLRTRWVTGKYIDVTESDPEKLLAIILMERRKELLNRGIRWSDLRRLNTDPRFQITLKRKLNGQEYTLPPNDPKYVFLIPRESIDRSGIPQNPR